MLLKLMLFLFLMPTNDAGLTISVERKRELTEAGNIYFAGNFEESAVLQDKSPITYNLTITPRFIRNEAKSLSYNFGDTAESSGRTMVRTFSIDSTYYYSLFDLGPAEGAKLYKAKLDELDSGKLEEPIVNLDFLWMMGLSAPSSLSDLPVSFDVRDSDVIGFEREVIMDGESVKVLLSREDDKLELKFGEGELASYVTEFRLFRRERLAIEGECTKASTIEVALDGRKHIIPTEFVFRRYAFRDISLFHDVPIIKDTYSVVSCKAGDVNEEAFALTAKEPGDIWFGPAFGVKPITVPAADENSKQAVESGNNESTGSSIRYVAVLSSISFIIAAALLWRFLR